MTNDVFPFLRCVFHCIVYQQMIVYLNPYNQTEVIAGVWMPSRRQRLHAKGRAILANVQLDKDALQTARAQSKITES